MGTQLTETSAGVSTTDVSEAAQPALAPEPMNSETAAKAKTVYVILASADGFRWDFLGRSNGSGGDAALRAFFEDENVDESKQVIAIPAGSWKPRRVKPRSRVSIGDV